MLKLIVGTVLIFFSLVPYSFGYGGAAHHLYWTSLSEAQAFSSPTILASEKRRAQKKVNSLDDSWYQHQTNNFSDPYYQRRRNRNAGKDVDSQIDDPVRSEKVGSVQETAQIVTGKTIILGTSTWDIETDQLVDNNPSMCDLWWQHKSNTERYLRAENGAKIAVVRNRQFEDIDLNYLQTLDLFGSQVSGGDEGGNLLPGAIVVIRTAEHNFAKLRVVRYFSSHDFTFNGAQFLSFQWKEFSKGKPVVQNYHMEVDWMLFLNPR